jgi:hypothetical protein
MAAKGPRLGWGHGLAFLRIYATPLVHRAEARGRITPSDGVF